MNDLNLLPDRNRSICFANETRCNADEAANPSRWPVSSGHMWVQGAAQDHTRSHPPSSQLSVPGPGWGASGGSCSPGVGVCVCVCVPVLVLMVVARTPKWRALWCNLREHRPRDWQGRRSNENEPTYWGCQIKAKGEALSRPRLDYVMHKQLVVGKKKKKKKKKERKKKNLKKCRPAQRLERNCSRAGAPPLSIWLFNDVAAGAPGLRMEPSEAPLACLHLSLRSWRWVLCALLRFTRSCSLCRGCWNPPREEQQQQQQRRRRRRQQQQQEEDRIPSSLCFTIQSPEHPQLLLFHPSKNKTKNTRFHAHRPGLPWGDAWSPLIMARNTLTDCSRRFGAAAGLRCLTVAAREARQAGRFTGLMLACPSGSLCVCLFVVGFFLCCVKES